MVFSKQCFSEWCVQRAVGIRKRRRHQKALKHWCFRAFFVPLKGFPLSQAEARNLKNTIWKPPFGTLRQTNVDKCRGEMQANASNASKCTQTQTNASHAPLVGFLTPPLCNFPVITLLFGKRPRAVARHSCESTSNNSTEICNLGKIQRWAKSLAFSNHGQLSPAIAQFYVERMSRA